jgi:hypothetical protein
MLSETPNGLFGEVVFSRRDFSVSPMDQMSTACFFVIQSEIEKAWALRFPCLREILPVNVHWLPRTWFDVGCWWISTCEILFREASILYFKTGLTARPQDSGNSRGTRPAGIRPGWRRRWATGPAWIWPGRNWGWRTGEAWIWPCGGRRRRRSRRQSCIYRVSYSRLRYLHLGDLRHRCGCNEPDHGEEPGNVGRKLHVEGT